jgi:NADH-quinone oxidoreductase subunit J
MLIFFFNLFAFSALFCSFFVITVINPVISVMFLVLVFIGISGLFFILQVEFIALIFVIVYVGAIAILFLFVVMMLDIKVTSKTNALFKYFPLGGVLGTVFLFKLFHTLFSDFIMPISNNSFEFFSWVFFLDKITNVDLLGRVLYTNFYVFFLLSGLILLVAMIGSIVLTLRFNNKVRSQLIFKQLSRNSNSAVFLVKN